MRSRFLAVGVLIVMAAGADPAFSQRWSLGGNMGLSLLGGSLGFQMTPRAEVLFNRSVGVGSEFSINTQYDVPLTTFPGDTTMATLEQVRAFARGSSARIQR
jgi:hypothetical protein